MIGFSEGRFLFGTFKKTSLKLINDVINNRKNDLNP